MNVAYTYIYIYPPELTTSNINDGLGRHVCIDPADNRLHSKTARCIMPIEPLTLTCIIEAYCVIVIHDVIVNPDTCQ
jgi:hypothetical protein